MKVLLLRVGVLGVLVALGCIAIARAQRDGDGSRLASSDANGSNPLRGSNVGPLPSTSSSNPMREQRQREESPVRLTAAETTIPDASAADMPKIRKNALRNESLRNEVSRNVPARNAPVRNDYVAQAESYPERENALRAEKKQNRAAESSPYLRNRTVTESGNGPALTANDGAETLQQRPSRINNRYAENVPRELPKQPAAVREPSRLMADPFALPADSKLQRQPDRSAQQFVSPVATSHAVESNVAEEGGTGRPGARQLEGVQSPQLTIQKFAPREIQVGKQASFRVVVRNAGQVPATDVEIHDFVPRGTRLVSTAPQASQGEGGRLVWNLGTLRPGEERPVEMQLMPVAEGEIGSVATVHFGVDATARTLATRPQLVVETSGPQKVLIGNQVTLHVVVSNPGSGVASGVVLEERIPPGLQHPAGAELEYEIGDLKPGESRKLDLTMTANRAGMTTNVLAARGTGNLRAEHKLEFEVLAPQLDVAMDGPKRRYLERQATYQVSVTNPGTASAKQVELVANLPAGLKFVSANNAGYYEETTRTVHWRLEELPANETGTVELVTMPVQPGQQAIRLRGTAQSGLNVEKEQPVVIEGIAAILFQVADSSDPIEVGGETSYEVHVINQGSKAASNVRLEVILPPELKALAAEGPARHSVEGGRVYFDGLASLAPKSETIYRIRAKSLQAGDLRVRFELQTNDMQRPVTKEESTRVYADE